MQRAAIGQQVDHREGLERPDQVQEDDDHENRLQTRKRDMEEPGDRPCAIHLGRFIERLGNGLHRRERDDGVEGEFAPNLSDHHGSEGGVRMACPKPASRAFKAQNIGEDVVQDAEIAIIDPRPAHCTDRDRHDPGDQQQENDKLLPFDIAVQKRRGQEGENNRAGGDHQNPNERIGEADVEQRFIGQDFKIIDTSETPVFAPRDRVEADIDVGEDREYHHDDDNHRCRSNDRLRKSGFLTDRRGLYPLLCAFLRNIRHRSTLPFH